MKSRKLKQANLLVTVVAPGRVRFQSVDPDAASKAAMQFNDRRNKREARPGVRWHWFRIETQTQDYGQPSLFGYESTKH